MCVQSVIIMTKLACFPAGGPSSGQLLGAGGNVPTDELQLFQAGAHGGSGEVQYAVPLPLPLGVRGARWGGRPEGIQGACVCVGVCVCVGIIMCTCKYVCGCMYVQIVHKYVFM